MVSSITSSNSLLSAIMSKLGQSASASSVNSNFSTADTNGDKLLSLDELSSMAPQDGKGPSAKSVMAAADTDGDNALSEEELSTFLSQMTQGGLSGSSNTQLAQSRSDDILSAGDTNGDGVLSYDEFAAMKPANAPADSSEELFAQADTDGDGSLTSSELEQFAQNAPMKGAGGPPPPPSSSSEEDDDELTLLEKLMEALTSTDSTTSTTDSTSTSDTQTTAEKLFSFFDQDSDGTVSETELGTGISSLQSAMKSYLLSLQEQQSAA